MQRRPQPAHSRQNGPNPQGPQPLLRTDICALFFKNSRPPARPFDGVSVDGGALVLRLPSVTSAHLVRDDGPARSLLRAALVAHRATKRGRVPDYRCHNNPSPAEYYW